MLIALLVILLFIVLIVALLNVSINVIVSYNDETELRCTLSYLFLKFTLIPQDEDKKRKKAERKKRKQEKRKKKGKSVKEKEKISFSEMFKNKGLNGFLDDMKTIVSSLWILISAVVRRAVIKKLDFKMIVASEDAADTAVTYGYANAVVYPVASAVMENVSECEDYNIQICPDFDEDAKPEVSFDVHIKIKPAKLLGALIENRASAEELVNSIR